MSVPEVKPEEYVEGSGQLLLSFTGVTKLIHSISGVGWSYGGDPAAGDYLLVESVAAGPTPTTIHRHYITKSGPGWIPFPKALAAVRDCGMNITLTNGNGVAASLFAMNHVGPPG